MLVGPGCKLCLFYFMSAILCCFQINSTSAQSVRSTEIPSLSDVAEHFSLTVFRFKEKIFFPLQARLHLSSSRLICASPERAPASSFLISNLHLQMRRFTFTNEAPLATLGTVYLMLYIQGSMKIGTFQYAAVKKKKKIACFVNSI